jgi:hypothetical protein
MKNILSLCICILLSGFGVSGQGSPAPSLLYKNEHNIGILMHTRGIGLDFEFSKYRNVTNYRLLDFSIYTLKHPKEVRQPNPDLADSRPYVFGKENSIIAMKANFGRRKILADRIVSQGVRLNFNYSFGPVMAFIKPIYYDIRVNDPDGGPKIVSEKFNPTDLAAQENILGPSSVFKGFGESAVLFGGNAKISCDFEWGPTDDKFYSLETGVLVDAFPVDVPIFAYDQNNKLFVNLFLTLSYGTRR